MPDFNQSKINALIVFVLGLLFSLYAAVSVMQGGVNQLIFYTAIVGGVAWVVLGQRAWWMPIPLAAVFGGMFWVGFRVYTHEVAMVMAFVALIPALILDRRNFTQHQRPKIPVAAWMLLVFLVIHMTTSYVAAGSENSMNKGSILRTYANALWPVIFFIYFYKYGSSKNLDRLLTILYALLVIRCLIGLYSYFFPKLLYVAGSNFFFIFSQFGASELRVPSLQLITIALSLAAYKKTSGKKYLHIAMALMAFWLLLLGSSRVGFAMALTTPLIIALAARQFIRVGVISVMITGLILVINANPDMLDSLPPQAQRALSVIVYGTNLDIYNTIEGSNEWHAYLFKSGWQRWTDSPISMAVGNRVHAFDDYFNSWTADLYARADIAAKTTRYERLLWTVLATLGLMGGLLYAAIYFKLFQGPFREIFRNRSGAITHPVYLIAFIQVLHALLFSPISGSFPAFDLVWGALALGLYYDQKAGNKTNNAAIGSPNGQ